MSTPTPISGVKVKISIDVQPISITNTSASKITTTSIKEVSNYEYEVLENEKLQNQWSQDIVNVLTQKEVNPGNFSREYSERRLSNQLGCCRFL